MEPDSMKDEIGRIFGVDPAILDLSDRELHAALHSGRLAEDGHGVVMLRESRSVRDGALIVEEHRWGPPTIDESVPPGVIRLVNDDGAVVGEIEIGELGARAIAAAEIERRSAAMAEGLRTSNFGRE